MFVHRAVPSFSSPGSFFYFPRAESESESEYTACHGDFDFITDALREETRVTEWGNREGYRIPTDSHSSRTHYTAQRIPYRHDNERPSPRSRGRRNASGTRHPDRRKPHAHTTHTPAITATSGYVGYSSSRGAAPLPSTTPPAKPSRKLRSRHRSYPSIDCTHPNSTTRANSCLSISAQLGRICPNANPVESSNRSLSISTTGRRSAIAKQKPAQSQGNPGLVPKCHQIKLGIPSKQRKKALSTLSQPRLGISDISGRASMIIFSFWSTPTCHLSLFRPR